MKTNAIIGALLRGLLPGLLIAAQALAETSPEAVLDAFHKAAAGTNQTAFIALLAEDAVFLGVDDGARLQGQSLRDYVSESFAGGNTWAYRSSDTDIHLSADGSVAWFDESLDHEQLGRGRASGVLVASGGSWKIAQYNLTLPLPGRVMATSAGASGVATGAAVPPAPQKPECKQLRHKTNKKSSC